MKNICLKLSVIGLALTSFGNIYASGCAIPSPTPGFSISLTGLYLQPNANNLQYAVYTHPLPITTPNWSQVTLSPGYTPAFNLGLQYNFANPANKVNLDWFNISTDDSTLFRAFGANSSVAPPYYFGPLAQALTGSFASSQTKFVVSDVGLTMGHLINLGNTIQIVPFAGMDYAYLKQDITSTYIGNGSDKNPYSITSYNTSKFTGIGPRLGMSAAYFITNHFDITARVGSSLLAGSMRSDTNFNSFGAGNKVAAYTTLSNQSQNKIVPEIDSKLEASYVFPLNGNGSNITLAAGYMFAAYINGINQVVPTSLVPGAFNTGTIAIETVGQNQSDLDLNGPYATVVWKI